MERKSLEWHQDYFARLQLNISAKEGESLLHVDFKSLIGERDILKIIHVKWESMCAFHAQEIAFMQGEIDKYKEALTISVDTVESYKKIQTLKNTPITRDSLLSFGMKEPSGDEKFIYPLLKRLDEETEEGGLYLGISTTQNNNQLALIMPEGNELFIAVQTIEELELFERLIHFYSPRN